MTFKDTYIQSADKKIHAIQTGSGESQLHFLHANGFSAGVYLPFLEHFKENFNVVATDIPGHGDSDHHGVDVIKHWDIFIEDIRESIIQNMSPPVIGIGHSLGAVVTYIAAAKYPELFSKIVLVDPVIFPKRKLLVVGLLRKLGLIDKVVPLVTGARRRKRFFESREDAYERFSSGRGLFKTWPDEFIRAYSQYGLKDEDDGGVSLKCNPETEAQIYESLLLDIWQYPKKIKCPVLLIRGGNSDTFDTYAAKRLVKELNDCSYVNVEDAGHFVPIEKAEECSVIIKEFINRN